MTYPTGRGNFSGNYTDITAAIHGPKIDQITKHPAMVVEHAALPAVEAVERTTIQGKDRFAPALKGWAISRNNALKSRYAAWLDRLKTR